MAGPVSVSQTYGSFLSIDDIKSSVRPDQWQTGKKRNTTADIIALSL